MPFDIRPGRSAVIRIRLDREAVLAVLRGMSEDGGSRDPGGPLVAEGYLTSGSVGARDFRFEYHLDSARNQQTYGVHGKVEDGRDWRILRLWLRARSPWLGWWGLAAVVLYGVWMVIADDVPPGAAVIGLSAAIVLLALVNLLWVPALVTSRVSAHLARELRGSVLQGDDDWLVP